MTSTVLTTYDPVQGTTFSVSPCPDCGAGSNEPCAWACSSNWGHGELDD